MWELVASEEPFIQPFLYLFRDTEEIWKCNMTSSLEALCFLVHIKGTWKGNKNTECLNVY